MEVGSLFCVDIKDHKKFSIDISDLNILTEKADGLSFCINDHLKTRFFDDINHLYSTIEGMGGRICDLSDAPDYYICSDDEYRDAIS